MIHALRYEPQSQHQRFESREQQSGEGEEKHIHLHLHLHFTWRASQGHSASLNPRRVKGMLSALAVASVIPLWLLPWAILPDDGPPLPAWEHLLVVWSFVSMVAGLALAWGAVGTLLRQVWRGSLRERLSLILPLAFLLLIILLTAAYSWLGYSGPPPLFLTLLGAIPFMGVFLAHPLIAALLLGKVSREAQALSQQALAHRKLGFVAVAGMALLLLGVLLFNIALLLSGGVVQMILFLPATCMAVIVAIRTSVRLFRSRGSAQARPKDTSPSDVADSHERGYYPVDRNKE